MLILCISNVYPFMSPLSTKPYKLILLLSMEGGIVQNAKSRTPKIGMLF